MPTPWVEPPQNNPENPIIPEPSDDASLYKSRKDLFRAAMNCEWKKVLELYKDEKVQGQQITRANDTLLHVAISGATEKIVLDLLNIVQVNKEKCNILTLQNKAGDTPLHLAAALGLEKVCRRMTKMCPGLVTSARNNLQETPLFSAVRYGKKKTFFVLEVAIHEEQNLTIDEKSLSGRDITHCRRDDGNNILHYAIKGEQFDLAYEIIRLYPQLACMNYVNSSGETALHTLANMPSVFKSGARFGLYDTIIYYCTITEPLKFKFVNFLENEKKNEKEEPSDIQKDENKVLPPTYKVCIDLFTLMKDLINCIFSTVAKNGICKACCPDEENPAGAQKGDENKLSENQEQRRWYPQNYDIMIFFLKIIAKLLLVVLGIGLRRRLQTITKYKQKHRNAFKIMKELVDRSTLWEYAYEEAHESPLSSDVGSKHPPMITSGETTDSGLDEKTVLNPSEGSNVMITIKEGGRDRLNIVLEMEENKSTKGPDTASPVLVAAKRGITEMVKRILEKYPVAVMDKDKDQKNIVLLAVEYRQVHVYKYMLGVKTMESVFRKVDKDDNNALHLVAMVSHSRPRSTGAGLQIQWDIKWYKYVHTQHSTMNLEIFSTINKAGKTPEEVFIESHDALVKDGRTWLTNISQFCSVVAALVATVTFASISTVPGGVDQQSGFPTLGNRPTFQLFTISTLVALCFSVTSVLMFLAILISNFKVWDFERSLPMKLIMGLTSLLMAIASMLVAFCAGDFFVVEYNLKFVVYPIYAIMCFAVTLFAFAQFPLYIDLIKLTIKKVPEPGMAKDY